MKHIFWFSVFSFLSTSTRSITAIDLVDISCDGEHTKKILYKYAGREPIGNCRDKACPQPLEYEVKARDSIHGGLTQNIRINGTGKCFDIFVRLRGIMTDGWKDWKVKKVKKDTFTITEGKLDIPGFESLKFKKREDSLCQNIIMSREIRYNRNRENKCEHTYKGRGAETKILDKYDNKDKKACMFYIGRYEHNPFFAWLSQKAILNRNKNETLGSFNISKNSIVINWGLAKKFNCEKKNVKKVKIQFVHKEKRLEKMKVRHFDEMYFGFENENHLDCYPWNVHINISMEFEMLKPRCKWHEKWDTRCHNMEEKYKQFKQMIVPTKSVSPGIGLEIVNTTLVKIKKKLNTDGFQCLEEAIQVKFLVPKKEKTMQTLKEGQVYIKDLLDDCQEYVIKFKLYDVLGNKISNTTFNLFPRISHQNITNNSLSFSITEPRFTNCPNVSIKLKCREDRNHSSKRVLSVNGLEINLASLSDYDVCKAKAYIVKDKFMRSRNWTNWFTLDGSKISDPSSLEPASVSLGVLMGAVLLVSAIAALIIKKKHQLRTTLKIEKTDKVLPAHMIFDHSETLSDELDNAAFLQEEVMNEFEKLEEYVKEKIEPEETAGIASENLMRNRYRDILPYDSNLVTLSRPTGFPKSYYINASWINFSQFEQKILAVQAPKKNMVSGFWQLVLDNNVTVIVMITKLVENNVVKADQYWPTQDKDCLELENSIKVIFKSESSDKGLVRRVFGVSNGEIELSVEQVHCQNWPDLQAPKDSSVLLDMCEVVEDLMGEDPGSLLVHCSAGVGRTGAFIGLYKLIKDFKNKAPHIDLFATVVEMRQARKKMVQKPVQYHYIIKCLADFVRGEVSDYA